MMYNWYLSNVYRQFLGNEMLRIQVMIIVAIIVYKRLLSMRFGLFLLVLFFLENCEWSR